MAFTVIFKAMSHSISNFAADPLKVVVNVRQEDVVKHGHEVDVCYSILWGKEIEVYGLRRRPNQPINLEHK